MSAPHRADAFAAGRYAIDRLKEILAGFKGKGVDLSEASQELQRLQRR